MNSSTPSRVTKKWILEGFASNLAADSGSLSGAGEFVRPSDQFDFYRKRFAPRNRLTDSNGFTFFGVDEIYKIVDFELKFDLPSRSQKEGWVFADYMETSWAYAFDRVEGSVFMIGTRSGFPERVANSFFEFMEMYVVDSISLYPE